jgi:hypothetical protein
VLQSSGLDPLLCAAACCSAASAASRVMPTHRSSSSGVRLRLSCSSPAVCTAADTANAMRSSCRGAGGSDAELELRQRRRGHDSAQELEPGLWLVFITELLMRDPFAHDTLRKWRQSYDMYTACLFAGLWRQARSVFSSMHVSRRSECTQDTLAHSLRMLLR